ncbi:MAG TPA: tripartite tricarboxylate transporter substrate binding protein [Ramlibacter sp.]|nr:tripartite tricarboxylate transporter substrate binding protein [Ramlibacter sp.]
MATLLSERLGQAVVVENRPGGNTLIGGQAVATAPRDGYTLLFVGGASLSSVFNRSPPFDMWTALTPVAPLYQGSYFLFTSAQLPVRTSQEFIAHARANPGKLNYGASGPGTMLAMEAFKAAAGLDITYIPYKGSSQVSAALASNEIQALFDAMASNRALLQAGKVKLVAAAASKRAADAPDTPTLAEAGYPSIAAGFNGGVWAPAGTPRAVIDRLNRELAQVRQSPQFAERVRAAGAEPVSGSPEDFGRIIRSELDFWRQAAAKANFQPE